MLLALRLTSGNSACACQPASWVCNAATKIHQTDKEGRRSFFQDGAPSQPFWGKIMHCVSPVLCGNSSEHCFNLSVPFFVALLKLPCYSSPLLGFIISSLFFSTNLSRLFSSCFIVIMSYHFTPTFKHWPMLFYPSLCFPSGPAVQFCHKVRLKMEEDTNACFLQVIVSLFLTIVNLSFRKT